MSDPYAQQPRPGDEPPSQPFRPMSYDLSPEYSTPPPAGQQPPPYQPPPAGQQPPYQPPQYPQYQDPQHPQAPPPYEQAPYQQAPPRYEQAPPPYQQPYQPQPYQQGYQPAFPGAAGPVMRPAPVKKRRRGLIITLSILGALVLVCGVVSCVIGYPIYSEYGAKVTAPDTLPGNLVKSTSTELQTSTDQVERELKSSYSADDAVASFYKDSTDESKLVLLVAASALILTPDSDINKAFNDAADGSLHIQGLAAYDSGKLGGHVKCGTAKPEDVDNTKVAACVWADHGSVGLVFFFNRDVSQSTSLFLQIREAVESR